MVFNLLRSINYMQMYLGGVRMGYFFFFFPRCDILSEQILREKQTIENAKKKKRKSRKHKENFGKYEGWSGSIL